MAGDGAEELPEDVWLWGCDTGADAPGVSVGLVIVCTDATGAIAGAVGIAGADMTGEIGLTGESTLVGFVTDLTQVLDDVSHEPHTGCP